jgi:acetyl esterase/lipase
MKKHLLTLSFLSLTCMAIAQTEMPLYTDSIPNSIPVPDTQKGVTGADGKLRISNVTRPTLTIYPAPKDKATGTAVIICPGGGYSMLAASHEGSDVALRFNEMGVTAFVLKYRLPDDSTMPNKEIGPVQDAQRAIQVVRQKAAEWGVDPNHIGLMGFSAGGHLASTAGTHFKHHYIEARRKENLRPDFLILGYPVISFSDSIGHKGSRTRLLGEHPTEEKIKEYCNELHVTKKTPPTFLVHAKDDKTVPVPNSQHFYEALQKHKVSAELYLYEKGGHGFGMNNKTSDVKWMDLLEQWMRSNGWIK